MSLKWRWYWCERCQDIEELTAMVETMWTPGQVWPEVKQPSLSTGTRWMFSCLYGFNKAQKYRTRHKISENRVIITRNCLAKPLVLLATVGRKFLACQESHDRKRTVLFIECLSNILTNFQLSNSLHLAATVLGREFRDFMTRMVLENLFLGGKSARYWCH